MTLDRRLRPDAAAVSPVVGTLMAVAITVVLAATVYVVVSGIGKSAHEPTDLHFLIDNRDGRVTVVQAGQGIDLSSIEVRLSVDGHFTYQGAAGLGSPGLAAGTFTRLASTPGTTFTGGDFISFCANAGGGGISVEIRDTPGNNLLYTSSFTNLATCS